LEEAHHVLKRANTGTDTHEGHAVQQHAIDTIVQLLREARGLGLGIILVDQLPGELAEAAVKLPGITIIHSLKDPRERAIVSGQANLTEEQMMYIGIMRRGEAVVHQGLEGEAVNVQVDHFQKKLPFNSVPWTNERVASHMEKFYADRPHRRVRRLPETNRWSPDPVVLWNLKYVTESSTFVETYDRLRKENPHLAENYVRNLVGINIDIDDPLESERYVNLILEHLQLNFSPEGEFDEGN